MNFGDNLPFAREAWVAAEAVTVEGLVDLNQPIGFLV
jgi:hypothetical protein